MRMPLGCLMVVIASLPAHGCSHASGAPAPLSGTSTHYVERVQRAHVEGHSERLQGLMSEHFGFVAWARDAASIGDVAAAREALLNLANANDDAVPGAWLPRVRTLKEDARAVARSTSLDQLAHGVAQLGRVCGECHRATGGGPAVSAPSQGAIERGADTFPDRMFRHREAIEALWMGLVAPSTASWNHGAAELAHASAQIRVEGELPAEYARAFKNLQDLGKRALLGGTPLDRAQSYGRILSACADCHTRPAPRSL